MNIQNLQVNIPNLQKQLKRDVPHLNDIVVCGVRQFLGVEAGPMEFPVPGAAATPKPSLNMVEFLLSINILEEKAASKKTKQLNS